MKNINVSHYRKEKRAHNKHDLYGTKTPTICHLALLFQFARGNMPPNPLEWLRAFSACQLYDPQKVHLHYPLARPLIGDQSIHHLQITLKAFHTWEAAK